MRRGYAFAAKVIALAALIALGEAASGFAQPGRKQIQKGNRLFREERYDEALVQYQDALVQSPNNPYARFNAGDAQYRKNKFEDAAQAFEKATAFEDPLLRSRAYYNLGNALYRLGRLPDAILAYKKALELNPNDEDAKYNLEYVRAKLKQESEKQQISPQSQQQQQQGGQGQQQGQQQEQQERRQDREEQKAQQGEQKQQETGGKQLQQGQMSKEEAERLLNALDEAEKKLLKDQRVHAGSIHRAKDW